MSVSLMPLRLLLVLLAGCLAWTATAIEGRVDLANRDDRGQEAIQEKRGEMRKEMREEMRQEEREEMIQAAEERIRQRKEQREINNKKLNQLRQATLIRKQDVRVGDRDIPYAGVILSVGILILASVAAWVYFPYRRDGWGTYRPAEKESPPAPPGLSNEARETLAILIRKTRV